MRVRVSAFGRGLCMCVLVAACEDTPANEDIPANLSLAIDDVPSPAPGTIEVAFQVGDRATLAGLSVTLFGLRPPTCPACPLRGSKIALVGPSSGPRSASQPSAKMSSATRSRTVTSAWRAAGAVAARVGR
jgi:hypothetical protein